MCRLYTLQRYPCSLNSLDAIALGHLNTSGSQSLELQPATGHSPRQWGQHWPLRRTGTLQRAAGQRWEKHSTVPLVQVQLVQALGFQESPASSTSPSPVMQYSCWLVFTGNRELTSSSSVDGRTE